MYGLCITKKLFKKLKKQVSVHNIDGIKRLKMLLK